jgi:hypothetical protein
MTIGGNDLTKKSLIILLETKLHVYKNGFLKAQACNNMAQAKKWKAGYIATRDRIYDLKCS